MRWRAWTIAVLLIMNSHPTLAQDPGQKIGMFLLPSAMPDAIMLVEDTSPKRRHSISIALPRLAQMPTSLF